MLARAIALDPMVAVTKPRPSLNAEMLLFRTGNHESLKPLLIGDETPHGQANPMPVL